MYVAGLEQPGAHILWALTAPHNYEFYGADAINKFTEAPPPTAHLYVTTDNSYREWSTIVISNPPIPRHHALPVQNSLQGYPEILRLVWANMIDKILTENDSMSTLHEPYLYSATVDDHKYIS